MSQQFDIVGNLLLKVDGAEAGLNKLKSSLSKLEIPKGLDSSLKKSFSNLDGLFAKYKAQLQDGFNTKADVSSFAKTGKQIEAEYDRISAAVTKLTGKEISFKMDLSSIQNAEKQLESLIAKKEELTKNIKGGLGLNKMLEAMQASDVGRRGTKVFDASNMLQVSLGRGDLEKARTDVEGLITELNRMSEARKNALETRVGTSFSNIIDTLRTSITGADNSLEDLNQDIKVTSDNMANIKADQMERAGRAIEEAVGDTDRLTSGFKELNGGAQQAAESMYSMTHQLEQLKNTTQYFFSLSNMINLFKRGVKEAVQTVKELDAAMTQTAVVTDFSVGDMWEKLPEYTANANALGATIQDMYESTTLYYQQGLNTQQAMGVATETMKMARIAGMEAAEATDMMTAALRGFNMEINEASAQHINDVYSQLAAKTASDTEELGTAMQRTASIAHSAGMSFEGTTAFLAQAIETTREPAENLGTAMKTIIARFQELKKNPLEMVEVDGEEVSFNKVDAALKTIGVDLKDTNGQFRALDEVFLDISQKWDSLSQTQQRYIATTAAGSRQQSRFIAMMSDYNRTVELMDYANNSAGASTDQFNKTLESLEAKLNKFQNAWKEFLMNIMNDSWTKKIVDGATSILDTVNNLIDKISGGSKGVKSFLSVFTAFTGLKAAGRLANMAIGGLGGILDPKSSMFKGMFGGATGMKQRTNAAQAKAISDPIVAVLRQIYAKMNGNEASQQGLQRGTWQDFKNAQSRFKSTAEKGSVSDVLKTLNGLDKAQINGILANNPVIEKRLQSGVNDFIGRLNLKEGTQKLANQAIPGIFQAFKNSPNMSPDAFIKALRPNQIGYALVKSGEKEAGQEIIRAYNQQTRQNVEAFMKEHGVNSWEEHKQRMNSPDGEGYKSALKDYLQNINTMPMPEPSKYEVLASKVSAVGAVFGTAGQAVTSFGLALSKIGFDKVGNGIANLGANISSIGATISSFAMTVLAVDKADGLKAIFAPLVAYLPIIIPALAAIGGAIWGISKARKEAEGIRNTAQEISDAFKETSDKTKENISNLKQYQSEWGRLLEGVDKNGNNVNLSTDDYDEYLRIVDEIAKINPAIVEGYNAQGRAIITNNKALEETLQKQREIQEEATKTYLEPESLQAILAARNINKDYRGATTTITNERVGRWREDQGFGGTKHVQTVPMANEVRKVISELKNQDWFTDEFSNNLKQQLGIDVDNLTDDTIRRIVSKEDEFTTAVSNMASSVGGEFSDKLVTSLEDLSTHTAAFEEAIQPTFEWLSTYINQMPMFDNIDTKLRPALQEGLKNIAGSELSFDEMQSEARKLTQEFDSLTNSSSQYSKAIKQAEDLQDKFASDLDVDAYTKAINAADGPINKLKQQLKDIKGRSDAAAQAEREFIETEIANIEKFTNSSFGNLSSALNTLQDDIAQAEGAFEAFSKSVESDYSTAVKGMQNIYDKIFEEVDINGSKQQLHTQGYGDKTFWTGAEAMLGQNVVAESTAKAKAKGQNPVEVLTKQMERLKPALQQGQEGYFGFLDLINTKYQNAGEKTQAQMEKLIGTFKDGRLDEFHIDEDNFSKVAELLKMSDDSLTSMLHNAMQFADLDFMDSEAVRKNLATSSEAIAGNGKTGGNQNLFVSEDYLRQQILDAGYRPEKVEGILDKLDKQGIKTIPSAKDLGNDTAAFFKNNLGVTTQQDLIDKLLPTGLFNESQIADYAKNMMGKDLFDPEQFHAAYNDALSKYEDPTGTAQVEQLTSIHSLVANILANLDPNHRENVEQATADFKQLIQGNTGIVDTVSEKFAMGQDAEGNKLTAESFKEARQNLVDIDTGLTATINNLKAEALTASGDHLKFLNQQIQGLEQLQEINKTNLSTGERIHKQTQENEKAQVKLQKEAHKMGGHLPEDESKTTDKGTTSTETKTINLTADDEASPVIDEAQDKADTFDNTEAEAKVEADTTGANKDLENTENKLDDLDGKTAETKVTTTTEEPTAPTAPADSTATVTITAENSQALAKANETVSTINGLESKMIVNANTDAALAKARGLARTISGLSASVKVTAYYSGDTIKIPTKADPIKPHTGGLVIPGGPIYRAKGGSIFKPKGTDTVPAMLTPGEYVQKRDAVEYFGVDFMRQINHKNLSGALASLKGKTNYRSSGGMISYYGDGGDVNGKVNYDWGQGKTEITVTVNTGNKGSGSTNNNNNNNSNQTAEEAEKIIQKAGKVVVWWENQARKVDAIQRKADKSLDGFNTLIKNGTLSFEQIKEIVGNKYAQELSEAQSRNQESYDRATSELNLLTSKKGSKAYKKQQAAVDKAQKKVDKAKTKAEKKKAKKELKKAKANLKGASIETGGTWTNVSYEVTKKTKITSGKNKSKTKTSTENKKANVNLSKYITTDSNGVPIIDGKAIKKVAKKNKSKATAIKSAAESEINTRLKRQQEAEDNMIKNHEAEVDYYNQLEDAFHGWKNELTEVYNLTNEIAKTEAKIGLAKAKNELAQAKIDALDLSFGSKGTNLGNLLKDVKASYAQEKELLNVREKQEADKLAATQSELQSALTLSSLEQQYAATAKQAEQGIVIGSSTVYDALSEAEKNAYAKSIMINKYLKLSETGDGTHSFDYKQLEADIANNQITGELGARLKEVFDTIADDESQILELQTSQVNTQTEKLQLEQQEKDYYIQIAEQLYRWKNSLTKILELTRQIEQIEKSTSYLKQADEFYQAQRRAGVSVDSSTVIDTFNGRLTSMLNQLGDSSKLLEEQRQDLLKYLDGNVIQNKIDHLEKDVEQTEVSKAEVDRLKKEQEIFKWAQRFIATTKNADGTVSYTYDSAEIEKRIGVDFNATTAGKIEEYAQTLVDKNSAIQESMANMLTQNTELYTLLAEAQQQVADRAKELREAYSVQQQKVIDNLKTLYSAVDSAFKDLIGQVKQSIQQRRQAEDNAKTESDISKKQQRLAALRANTAGGNQVAIAQLEKEIADAQQAYGRTLEDQMLDKISQQGDEAAKQRQQQIDLLQAQRNIAQKTGEDAAIISAWVSKPDEHKEEIQGVLKAGESWDALTTQEQQVLETTVGEKVATLVDLVGEIPAVKEAIKNAEAYKEANNNNIENTITTAENHTTDQTNRENELRQRTADDIAAAEKAAKDEADRKAAIDAQRADLEAQIRELRNQQGVAENNRTNTVRQMNSIHPVKSLHEEHTLRTEIKDLQNQIKDLELQKQFADIDSIGLHGNAWEARHRKEDLDKKIADLQKQLTPKQASLQSITDAQKQAEEEQHRLIKEKSSYTKEINNLKDQINALTAQLNTLHYASGGLSTHTGPAWLDGTPSKPELVLNAADTQNFLALRDVLSKAIGSTTSVSNSSTGDIMYEININVDKIEKDYDVDRVVEKVKKEIVKGAGYRNVTQVRNFR